MSGATTGAVLMILATMAMYLTNVIDPEEFGTHYRAMCMIAMTFSGFIMVFRICQPFNVYRGVLCLAVFGIIVGCYCIGGLTDVFLYTDWTKLTWDYAKILTIVVVIEACFPISGWLQEVSRMLFPSTRKKDSNDPKDKDKKKTNVVK